MDTLGTSHFVLYREVVLSLEVSIMEKGPQSVSFIERFFYVFFIRSVHYQRFLLNVNISLILWFC